VFRGIGLAELENFLSLHQWDRKVVFPFDQYLPDPDLHHLKIQDLQLQSRNLCRRVHGRFWQFGDEVLANVHREVISIPAHVVLDYHAAEMLAADICERNSLWKVQTNSIDYQNYFGGHGIPYSDGRATLVSR
jgi:hypothetical protein